MKNIRKWSRILHRDIGFFIIGTSLIYGLSGIAMNHAKDWNPSYIVTVDSIQYTDIFAHKSPEEEIKKWLATHNFENQYKAHHYPSAQTAKIFLTNSSTITLNLNTKKATIETIRPRPVFKQMVSLHYNPNKWWTWFSDIFAVGLILMALTSLVMVKGKKGTWGRGGIYIIAGIIIPILILILT